MLLMYACVLSLIINQFSWLFYLWLPFHLIFLNAINVNHAKIDLIYRLKLDEFVIHWCACSWTNMWYLLFVLSFTLLIRFFYYKAIYKLFIFCSIIVFVSYFYEFNSIFYVNNQLSLICNFEINNNLLLLNLLNRYHPGLLYFSIIIFFNCKLVFNFIFFSKYYFQKLFLINLFKKFNYLQLNTISIALLFGSWWAEQEGSWGGWWNWDSSETFGLMFLLASLIRYHFLFNSFYFKYKYFIISLLPPVLLCLYYFLQLNFSLISHNFGIKFFYFLDTGWFLLELELILFFYLFIIFYNNTLNLIQFFFKKNIFLVNLFTYWVLKVINWCLIITALFLVYLSYEILFNYFFWTIMFLNFCNTTNTISITLFYLLLLLLISYTDIFLIFVLYPLQVLIQISVIYWSLTYYFFNATPLIHNVLYTMFIVSSLSAFCQIYEFIYSSFNLFAYLDANIYIRQDLISLDLDLINFGYLILTGWNCTDLNYFCFFIKNENFLIFYFYECFSISAQLLFSIINLTITMVFSSEYFLQYLLLLFIFILQILLLNYFKNIKIIF